MNGYERAQPFCPKLAWQGKTDSSECNESEAQPLKGTGGSLAERRQAQRGEMIEKHSSSDTL